MLARFDVALYRAASVNNVATVSRGSDNLDLQEPRRPAPALAAAAAGALALNPRLSRGAPDWHPEIDPNSLSPNSTPRRSLAHLLVGVETFVPAGAGLARPGNGEPAPVELEITCDSGMGAGSIDPAYAPSHPHAS
jgi:hypothetical protein